MVEASAFLIYSVRRLIGVPQGRKFSTVKER